MIGLGTHPTSVVGVAKDYCIEQLLAGTNNLDRILPVVYYQKILSVGVSGRQVNFS
jgi:hypothetical protein